MGEVRARVLISGRVQGVGYRHYARRKAESLGLNGWVKNLSNGKVEGVFEGEKVRVEKMIEWCWEGAPLAEVRGVEVKWGEAEEIEGFEVRDSA